MNNIDVIEGSIKIILAELDAVWRDAHLEDSEYIRNTKAVIDGADRFIRENVEITTAPDVLVNVLYEYAKETWLAHRTTVEKPTGVDQPANGDYDEYCFDYIYKHGVYPR